MQRIKRQVSQNNDEGKMQYRGCKNCFCNLEQIFPSHTNIKSIENLMHHRAFCATITKRDAQRKGHPAHQPTQSSTLPQHKLRQGPFVVVVTYRKSGMNCKFWHFLRKHLNCARRASSEKDSSVLRYDTTTNRPTDSSAPFSIFFCIHIVSL